jgi:glycosyltransferase involved in cell wall biosynthesis
MKILMVAHSFPPDAFAGVELHVYNLALILGERHEVHVLHTLRKEGAECSITHGEYQGVPTLRLVNDPSSPATDELDVAPAVREVFGRSLDSLQPDVIHFHHLITLSADLPDEARARGIPSIASLHDYWYICSRVQLYVPGVGRCKGPSPFRCGGCFDRQNPLIRIMHRFSFLGERGARGCMNLFPFVHWPGVYRLYERRFARMRKTLSQFNLLVANSKFLKERYIRFGVPPGRIVVVHPGQDPTLLRPFRHAPSADIRFGFVGSIVEHKGLHVMVEAFRRVPEAALQVWGDTEMNDTVRAYKASLIPSHNIRFMGPFDNREIGRVLSGIDVLVVPPIWEEAYGLTVDEAKAAGIPVIASRIGGIPEHLEDGREGYLFTPGSVDELERLIRRLAGRSDRVKMLRPSGEDIPTLDENAKDLETYYGSAIRKASQGDGEETDE